MNISWVCRSVCFYVPLVSIIIPHRNLRWVHLTDLFGTHYFVGHLTFWSGSVFTKNQAGTGVSIMFIEEEFIFPTVDYPCHARLPKSHFLLAQSWRHAVDCSASRGLPWTDWSCSWQPASSIGWCSLISSNPYISSHPKWWWDWESSCQILCCLLVVIVSGSRQFSIGECFGDKELNRRLATVQLWERDKSGLSKWYSGSQNNGRQPSESSFTVNPMVSEHWCTSTISSRNIALKIRRSSDGPIRQNPTYRHMNT